jgi:hypothetical protein
MSNCFKVFRLPRGDDWMLVASAVIGDTSYNVDDAVFVLDRNPLRLTSDAAALLTLTTGNGVSINGHEISVTVPAETTRNIAEGSYLWAVRGTAGTVSTTLSEGVVHVYRAAALGA